MVSRIGAADVRGDWQALEAAFRARFALVARKEVDQTSFLNLALNLKQRGRSIVDYTREGGPTSRKVPPRSSEVYWDTSLLRVWTTKGK